MPIIGLAQLAGTVPTPASSRARCEDAVRALAAANADLAVLPELAVPGYTLDPEVLAGAAEPLDGPTVSSWQALARLTGTAIVGGFCERGPTKPYNSVVMVDASGIRIHYRKLHLFGAEKAVFAPGDLGLPVADTPVGRIGICVCYDLRFVEVMRVLALQGAELICVPSAWVEGFDSSPDLREAGCPQSDGAQLQANLNQVFVACASFAGANSTTSFLGSSLLVDPTGHPVLGPRNRTESWLGTHEINVSEVQRAQDRGGGISPRSDRRTDVYRLRYREEDL